MHEESKQGSVSHYGESIYFLGVLILNFPLYFGINILQKRKPRPALYTYISLSFPNTQVSAPMKENKNNPLVLIRQCHYLHAVW